MAVSDLADLHQPNHQPVLNPVRPLRDTSVGKVAAMYADQRSTSQARSYHAWTTSDETCKGSSCNVDSSTSASASHGSAATVARMVAQPTDEAFHFTSSDTCASTSGVPGTGLPTIPGRFTIRRERPCHPATCAC